LSSPIGGKVESQIVTHVPVALSQQGVRARVIALLGPLTSVGGIVWAIAQPYRITLLHPHHQTFWWLLIEPPLLVVGAGLFFTYAVARPLLADFEEGHATSR
jgi:hypothetical protein